MTYPHGGYTNDDPISELPRVPDGPATGAKPKPKTSDEYVEEITARQHQHRPQPFPQPADDTLERMREAVVNDQQLLHREPPIRHVVVLADDDEETLVLADIVGALEKLTPLQRNRVINYLHARYSSLV